jgi:hypothetical protein
MINPIDALESLPDALAMRSGHRVQAAHPHAQQCAEMSLAELARLTGELVIARDGRPRPASDGAIFGLGMTSDEFGVGLGQGLERLMIRQFDAGTEHRRFCATRTVPNFHPVELPSVDLAADLEELREGNELRHLPAFNVGPGESLRIRSFGSIVKIPRAVLVNDQWDTLAEAFSGLGGSASRIESQMVYGALEQTETLRDGEPVFSTDHGNRIEQPLSKGALSQAMAALRTMPITLGKKAQPANMTARHLIVSAASELEAHEILHNAGLEFVARELVAQSGVGIRVHATPHLPQGRWYLLPDPDLFPVTCILALNEGRQPITVGPSRRRELAGYDGIGMSFMADLGAGLVSRLAIRGGE